MFRKMKERLNNRKGYATVLFVIMMAGILPFLLFYFVELTYLHGVKERLTNYTNIAASGAVLQLDKTQLPDGKIVIIDTEATSIAQKLFYQNVRMTEAGDMTSDSIVTEAPTVKVYVLNHNPSDTPTEFITDEGFTYQVRRPMVIVYTVAKPQGIIFNKFARIESISAYETLFKTDKDQQVTNKPQVSPDGLVVTMDRVVNPLRFPSDTKVFPVDWKFDALSMAAGANIDFSVHSTDPNVTLNAANYVLKFNGTQYNRQVTGSMTKVSNTQLKATVQLPDDAPIGSTVTMDFTTMDINKVFVLPWFTTPPIRIPGRSGFATGGEQIGNIESNIYDLVRINQVGFTSQTAN